jgi:hypothetical protein
MNDADRMVENVESVEKIKEKLQTSITGREEMYNRMQEVHLLQTELDFPEHFEKVRPAAGKEGV